VKVCIDYGNNSHARTHTRAHTHTHTHARTHTRKLSRARAHTHTHTCARARARTHARSRAPRSHKNLTTTIGLYRPANRRLRANAPRHVSPATQNAHAKAPPHRQHALQNAAEPRRPPMLTNSTTSMKSGAAPAAGLTSGRLAAPYSVVSKPISQNRHLECATTYNDTHATHSTSSAYSPPPVDGWPACLKH
jgi:hypothetical protein